VKVGIFSLYLDLKNLIGAGFKLRTDAGIRVQVAAGFVTGAEYCKNRDKQMHFIVRVSLSDLF